MSIDTQAHRLDLEIDLHPPDSVMTLLDVDGWAGKVNHCFDMVALS